MMQFVDYLKARGVPEQFLAAYGDGATDFLSRFAEVREDVLSQVHVEEYLQGSRRAGSSERTLRNRRIVAETVLAFLKARASGPHARRSTEPRSRDSRRLKRIPFIQRLEVHGYGTCRCSDVSMGGMYLETVNTIHVGTILDLDFKLRDSDPEPIRVRARVVYEHPDLGVGLAFVAISKEHKEALRRFIDAA